MRGSPPLRFLAMVLGGWAAVRTAIVVPPWPAAPADAAAAAVGKANIPPGPEPRFPPRPAGSSPASQPPAPVSRVAATPHRAGPAGPERPHRALESPLPAAAEPTRRLVAERPRPASPTSPPQLAAAPPAGPARGREGRWSLSAWSFVRRGEGAALASSGLLGASQAGARLRYRLNGDPALPLALSFRLSAPLGNRRGAEAAFGIEGRLSRRLPVNLLVERRQALGKAGRSGFGLTVHGGVGDAALGRLRLDGYGQAGVVGNRSRDLFADGSARLSLPLGRARFGAGAWGAAQPGAARLDLGPQAALRLPIAGRAVTLAADWRLRVAGDAEPGSGPTVTLATDF